MFACWGEGRGGLLDKIVVLLRSQVHKDTCLLSGHTMLCGVSQTMAAIPPPTPQRKALLQLTAWHYQQMCCLSCAGSQLRTDTVPAHPVCSTPRHPAWEHVLWRATAISFPALQKCNAAEAPMHHPKKMGLMYMWLASRSKDPPGPTIHSRL